MSGQQQGITMVCHAQSQLGITRKPSASWQTSRQACAPALCPATEGEGHSARLSGTHHSRRRCPAPVVASTSAFTLLPVALTHRSVAGFLPDQPPAVPSGSRAVSTPNSPALPSTGRVWFGDACPARVRERSAGTVPIPVAAGDMVQLYHSLADTPADAGRTHCKVGHASPFSTPLSSGRPDPSSGGRPTCLIARTPLAPGRSHLKPPASCMDARRSPVTQGRAAGGSSKATRTPRLASASQTAINPFFTSAPPHPRLPLGMSEPDSASNPVFTSVPS